MLAICISRNDYCAIFFVDPKGDQIHKLSQDILAMEKRLGIALEKKTSFYVKKRLLTRLRHLRAKLDKLENSDH
jgi:uncharacterized protein YxjI